MVVVYQTVVLWGWSCWGGGEECFAAGMSMWLRDMARMQPIDFRIGDVMRGLDMKILNIIT